MYLRQCQNDRLAFGDNDRMLELSGDGIVHGFQGPAIGLLDDVSLPGGKERLNGEDQAIIHSAAVIWLVEVIDRGWLVVQLTPDAMPGLK